MKNFKSSNIKDNDDNYNKSNYLFEHLLYTRHQKNSEDYLLQSSQQSPCYPPHFADEERS